MAIASVRKKRNKIYKEWEKNNKKTWNLKSEKRTTWKNEFRKNLEGGQSWKYLLGTLGKTC